MKKYIAPAVEMLSITPSTIIATSFILSDKDTTEQLSRENSWNNIWDDDNED